MVMRQNSELLGENEKISKLLHEKKSDFELMKNKYQAAIAHRAGIASESEFEKKQLLNEIDHLKT